MTSKSVCAVQPGESMSSSSTTNVDAERPAGVTNFSDFLEEPIGRTDQDSRAMPKGVTERLIELERPATRKRM